MKKFGFSLVELSVVIVIIGLLVGAALAGQSLWQTAKISTAVADLSKMEANIQKFRVKYKELPGDSSQVNRTYPGNSDGMIDESEAGHAWQDMSLALGIKNKNGANFAAASGSCSGTNATGQIVNEHCPALNIRNTTQALSTTNACVSIIFDNRYAPEQNNALLYADYSQAYGSCLPYVGPLYPKDAYAMDVKLDDGKPTTGNVLGWGNDGNACEDAALAYAISNDSTGCMLRVGLGTVTGK